ncbi:MAG: CMP-N-acetylneuraminic acid synthetase [Myxococcota bacterium]|jgi:CMP-N-acetylneuraminic acid synthetase
MQASPTRLIALVPMRHGSERVPLKNIRTFAGRPLYHQIIETLRATPEVTSIVIDTDSAPLKEDAARHFPDVRILHRPTMLAQGMVTMNDVLAHTLQQLRGDWFLQTHATNPLLRAETISAAIAAHRAKPEHDSLFSVTQLQTRLYDAAGQAINHNPARLERTQDLAPVYEENSCLYVFRRDVFARRHNRIGAKPLLYPIDPIEALDIDEPTDFILAEQLFLLNPAGKDAVGVGPAGATKEPLE